MAYEQKNGEFSCFKNDKYEESGKQPYLKGKGKDLQGNDIEVSAWLNKFEKDGKTQHCFNFKMQPAYVKPVEQNQQSNPSDLNPASSDLPF